MGRLTAPAPVEALLPALGRLDAFLHATAAGAPAAASISAPAPGEPPSRLDGLGEAFGLDAFDLDVLLLALAPELDRRHGELLAGLQRDARAVRPSVDLVLGLLCRSAGERLARRGRLGAHGPLATAGVLRPRPDGMPAALLEVEPRVVDHLLGDDTIDDGLAACGRLLEAGAAPVPADGTGDLDALAAALARLGPGAALALEGPPAADAVGLAHALAERRGTALLVLDPSLAEAGLARTLAVAEREAVLQGALLCLECREEAPPVRLAALRQAILVATPDARSLDAAGLRELVVVRVAPPGPAARQQLWRRALGSPPVDVDLAALASRFRLGRPEIERAVADARGRALLRAAASDEAPLTGEDVYAAARARCGGGLDALATRSRGPAGWDDIVLPDDSRQQLRDLCARVEQRDRVVDGWGFRRTVGAGLGVSALFAGASGTGKTMAAGVLARALRLDLHVIDLSTVVSKYIGETAKNLSRLFAAAEDANAILFFDEADALFGKRSEVRDSHDRYANVEVAHLLQRMEAYDGVAILATNLRQSLDDAFARRLAFTVHFPFPDATQRRAIWRRVWPAEVPLAGDVDLDDLADRFRLSGGTIRNAALAAAFLAAADDGPVRREHLLLALRREYQKLGRALSTAELTGVTEDAAVGALA